MPGSIGALSGDRVDLFNCNWVRAVGYDFSHTGMGDRYADATSHAHRHSDSDRNAHPDRYPNSRAHCHPDPSA